MSLIAKLDYYNLTTTYPDQNGGEVAYADVYISIIDSATSQPANGNNCVVSYHQDDNGLQTDREATIAAQSFRIYSGKLSESHYNQLGQQTYNFYVNFNITSLTAGTGATLPPLTGGCDIAISTIRIDQSETATGAGDGQITVRASSSYLPLSYSLDNENFQQSPVFAGLTGGLKTVYVRDANNCTAQLSVQLPTLSSLLVSDPTVTLPDGHISRWNAAFNPIVFTYQRKDFAVLDVTEDTQTGKALVRVNATLIAPATNKPYLSPDDKVYLHAGTYQGAYKVIAISNTSYLLIDALYNGSASGYININQMRPYYHVRTRITYADKATGALRSMESTNRPDASGMIRADLSSFLQSLVQPADHSDYTQPNYRDDELCASYSIAYAEAWDQGAETRVSPYIPIADNYYVLYAAKQLGEQYGGNLAAYVPFTGLADGLEKACWVTDFAEPAYSNGYPFDIGFIYSEALLGRNMYCEFTLLDINRNPLSGGTETSGLLNEDGSWLLNSDGSRMIIARQSTGNIPVPQQLGLNRLLIDTNFAPDVYYVNITLKYDDEGQTHAVAKTQTIRVDDAIDDNSVYLRWIGLTGSWNYYRFVFNQEVSLDVQNAVIIKNYVSDWENQQSIEEVISKSAGQKMKVVAEDLSVADIKGLQSIKYSPKVQMLVNRNPVKWQTIVINTATYSEYETRNGQAPFSVTFNLPALNIQTQ